MPVMVRTNTASSLTARPVGAELYLLPVTTRMPLKFGPETLTTVTCARVRMTVRSDTGHLATGWGETPLSVQWVWPNSLPYAERHSALVQLCLLLARAWAGFATAGHPLEVGHQFAQTVLLDVWKRFNAQRAPADAMPWLAALACCSPFDIALHDAYGVLVQQPIWQTYRPPYMTQDLSTFLQPAEGSHVRFNGLFPASFLSGQGDTMPAWHLVGGLDPLTTGDLRGDEPDDGHPVLLSDWIRRDGLQCLKIKRRGTDAAWDLARLRAVGHIALEHRCRWLTADFNCTVEHPAYVNDILDTLLYTEPRIYGMLLYVEQPFSYDLERWQLDVHSVSARKPLFMDESAHDWHLLRLGRSLGWNGVALKTCKTLSGAILSLCWAKAHGMAIMVQDLTNPMLAQIAHVALAAHAGTLMGVETNSMQFYPDASAPEAVAHPGLFQRRMGRVDVRSLRGPGIGYRIEEIARALPAPALRVGESGE